MKPQMIYTRAKTVGPFLTLILLSSRRDEATSEVPHSSAEGPSSYHTDFVTREEASSETKPAPRPPLRLGPILTLILTVGRSQWKPAPVAFKTTAKAS